MSNVVGIGISSVEANIASTDHMSNNKVTVKYLDSKTWKILSGDLLLLLKGVLVNIGTGLSRGHRPAHFTHEVDLNFLFTPLYESCGKG